jgi:hypothetical protein
VSDYKATPNFSDKELGGKKVLYLDKCCFIYLYQNFAVTSLHKNIQAVNTKGTQTGQLKDAST